MMKITMTIFTLILCLVTDVYAENRVVVVPLPSDNGYKPQNPLVIGAVELRVGPTYTDYVYFNAPEGFVRGHGVAAGCLYAPVYLPHSVKVTKFSALVYDNSTLNVSVRLLKKQLLTPSDKSQTMAIVDSSQGIDAYGEIETTDISYSNINTKANVYYLSTCLGSASLRIYAIKIHYQE